MSDCDYDMLNSANISCSLLVHCDLFDGTVVTSACLHDQAPLRRATRICSEYWNDFSLWSYGLNCSYVCLHLILNEVVRAKIVWRWMSFLVMSLDQDLTELVLVCCQYDWLGENMQDRGRAAGLYIFLLLHCRHVLFLLILPCSLICFNENLMMAWFCEGQKLKSALGLYSVLHLLKLNNMYSWW